MTALASIDLGAIRRNVARLSSLAPRAISCAVVKADGYGHGAAHVAEAALAGGATWLAVATPAEAVGIAGAAIDRATPILLLSEPDPEALTASWEDRPPGLRCTVASAAGAATLSRLVAKGPPVPVHLKLDTGMHRMGVAPQDAAVLADLVVASPGLELEGVWTHFAIADQPDDEFTATQIERFDHGIQALHRAGHVPAIEHLCNSAGAIAHPDAHRGLVRLGIAMYGHAPSPQLEGRVELEPALRLQATITGLRTVDVGESVSYGRRFFATTPTRVATVDIGYADGIRRASPEAGVEVLVRGQRAPMLGVVTMDQLMVAVGDDAALGDEVVLIGTQGDAVITGAEIAGRLGTIAYEVLTGLGSRVRRVFVG